MCTGLKLIPEPSLPALLKHTDDTTVRVRVKPKRERNFRNDMKKVYTGLLSR